MSFVLHPLLTLQLQTLMDTLVHFSTYLVTVTGNVGIAA